jgi:hypothetical protein
MQSGRWLVGFSGEMKMELKEEAKWRMEIQSADDDREVKGQEER